MKVVPNATGLMNGRAPEVCNAVSSRCDLSRLERTEEKWDKTQDGIQYKKLRMEQEIRLEEEQDVDRQMDECVMRRGGALDEPCGLPPIIPGD